MLFGIIIGEKGGKLETIGVPGLLSVVKKEFRRIKKGGGDGFSDIFLLTSRYVVKKHFRTAGKRAEAALHSAPPAAGADAPPAETAPDVGAYTPPAADGEVPESGEDFAEIADAPAAPKKRGRPAKAKDAGPGPGEG